jgi:hypothetical protein
MRNNFPIKRFLAFSPCHSKLEIQGLRQPAVNLNQKKVRLSQPHFFLNPPPLKNRVNTRDSPEWHFPQPIRRDKGGEKGIDVLLGAEGDDVDSAIKRDGRVGEIMDPDAARIDVHVFSGEDQLASISERVRAIRMNATHDDDKLCR